MLRNSFWQFLKIIATITPRACGCWQKTRDDYKKRKFFSFISFDFFFFLQSNALTIFTQLSQKPKSWNILLLNGACASIIFLCVLIAIKLLFKLWWSHASPVNSLKVNAKFFFFAESFYLPQIPGRLASGYIDVREVCVHWADRHLDPLPLLVPEDLEADLHVDLPLVGHVLPPTARDLHAAEEAKVDPLPDPGPGVHSYV